MTDHVLCGHRMYQGKVVMAACSCGEITNYRVPLNDLKEFVCPRDPNREGVKRG
jgi:hypothetical protein